MEHDPLIDQLPTALGVVIRLADAGYSDDVIADALDVPLSSVPTLRELAREKLARLTAPDEGPEAENSVVDY
ncbi:hypothetical protein [Nocardioides terrisoli]|uniref:hypothetical protein n=1 Tax=Nocardioides terrisoli TaxID=3388267 RepID=UPI00287BAD29|nr:hypothetical protein [Nocardioides marmorisolisilvae]